MFSWPSFIFAALVNEENHSWPDHVYVMIFIGVPLIFAQLDFKSEVKFNL